MMNILNLGALELQSWQSISEGRISCG